MKLRNVQPPENGTHCLSEKGDVPRFSGDLDGVRRIGHRDTCQDKTQQDVRWSKSA